MHSVSSVRQSDHPKATRPVRVAFNAQILTDSVFRGWNRYTVNLISELAQMGAEVCLYSDAPLDPAQARRLPLDLITVRQSRRMPYLMWEQYWLTRQCATDQIDVFHSPIHFGVPQLSSVPCVLTLHDAIDQIYYSARNRRPTWSQRVTTALGDMARHRADHVMTVSEHSKQDLIRHLGVPEHKISVTYEGADAHFHRPISLDERIRIRLKHTMSGSYLFYVGSLEPRKNLGFLVRALAISELKDLHLVIGGGQPDEREDLMQLATNLMIADRVHMLGPVADEDLPALYAEAQCFVYPSEYEGFGLQLCEAMAVGCPILAADMSALPEILGNGGETFGVSDSAELAHLITRVHRDEEYRRSLQRRALERSQRFSWRRMAEETLDVYHRLWTKTNTGN